MTLFPEASVYVQTTVVFDVIGNVVVVVPFSVPEQLSVAVGGVKLVTGPHGEFTAVKLATVGTGAIASPACTT